MAGFIRNLFSKFGKKAPAESQAIAQPPPQPKPSPARRQSAQSSEGTNSGPDFFLEFDTARTLGDFDYMKTAKTVKHTFPKGPAQVQSISSEVARKLSNLGKTGITTPAPFSSNSARPVPPPIAAPTRRRDPGMDVFRSMAKQLGR